MAVKEAVEQLNSNCQERDTAIKVHQNTIFFLQKQNEMDMEEIFQLESGNA